MFKLFGLKGAFGSLAFVGVAWFGAYWSFV